MNNRVKIILENWDAYIAALAALPDIELAEKLDLIHIQSELAMKKNNEESIELLEIWRSQVIEARIYKAENNVPDAPNEIELAISDIETTLAKSEERAVTLNGEEMPRRGIKAKIREDNSDQMSLF